MIASRADDDRPGATLERLRTAAVAEPETFGLDCVTTGLADRLPVPAQDVSVTPAG